MTNLRCGAMILCTAINHCLCDGIGTSEFLHAWAHHTKTPSTDLRFSPFHFRHVLIPRNPPQVTFPHPTFTNSFPQKTLNLSQYLQSHPLLPASLTFTADDILRLKRQCVPSLKCTTFEALASHTWRCWVKSLDLPPSSPVKLLFSVNVRKRLIPQIPQGYYGNAFVLACAESVVDDVASDNLHRGVKVVQNAKSTLTDDYVKSMIDHLNDKALRTDLSCSLVISQWSRLGLEDLDFGEGKPLLMGSLISDIYCLFLPVIGDRDSVRVLVSMPEGIVRKFKYYMTEFSETAVKQN